MHRLILSAVLICAQGCGGESTSLAPPAGETVSDGAVLDVMAADLGDSGGRGDGPIEYTRECVRPDLNDLDHAASPLCAGTGEPLFEDLTEASGLIHVHHVGGPDTHYDRSMGGGAALDDFDGDGDLDLAVTSERFANQLFVNQGDGTFLPCGYGHGLVWNQDRTYGLSSVDYDGDGHVDLLSLNVGANRLLRNRGDGTFEDVTEAAGLVGTERSASAAWADLDRDGDLDLVLPALAEAFWPSQFRIVRGKTSMYRNEGDGRLTLMPEVGQLGPFPPGSSFLAPLLDLDDDGWVDLLLTQEFGGMSTKTHMFRNMGPAVDGWLDWQLESAFQPAITEPGGVMGVAVLDVNDDFRPDLYLTNLSSERPGREVLHVNQGSFGFVDETEARGLATMSVSPPLDNRSVSWGTVAEDFDNDGDVDVYTTYGHFMTAADFQTDPAGFPSIRPNQPNVLSLQGPPGQFTERTGACAEDPGRSRAVLAADVDEDGCVDLIVINQDGPLRYLHNRCTGTGRGLNLRLLQEGGNAEAIGARLRLSTSAGVQTRWISKSTALSSGQPARVHFGIPADAVFESLEVRWPDGQIQNVDELELTPGLQTIRRTSD